MLARRCRRHLGALAEAWEKTLLLTGTPLGGYASTLVHRLYRVSLANRAEVAHSDEATWMARYGYLARIIKRDPDARGPAAHVGVVAILVTSDEGASAGGGGLRRVAPPGTRGHRPQPARMLPAMSTLELGSERREAMSHPRLLPVSGARSRWSA